MRCYYGNGPRDGTPLEQFIPQNPSTEMIPEISQLKDTTIGKVTPKGYNPRGVAAEKLKVKQSGIRHDTTTEK